MTYYCEFKTRMKDSPGIISNGRWSYNTLNSAECAAKKHYKLNRKMHLSCVTDRNGRIKMALGYTAIQIKD